MTNAYYDTSRFPALPSALPMRIVYPTELWALYTGDWTALPLTDARMNVPDPSVITKLTLPTGVPVCVDVEHLLRKPASELPSSIAGNCLTRSVPILNQLVQAIQARHDASVGLFEELLQYDFWMMQEKDNPLYQSWLNVVAYIQASMQSRIRFQSAYFIGAGVIGEFWGWNLMAQRLIAASRALPTFIFLCPFSLTTKQLVSLDLWKKQVGAVRSQANAVLWTFAGTTVPDNYLAAFTA